MNTRDILSKAIEELGKKPVLPFIPQTTLQSLFTREPSGIDPGSLYGAFQENPQESMTGAVMGMTAPIEGKGYMVKPPPGSFPEGWKGVPVNQDIPRINLDTTTIEKLGLLQKLKNIFK